MPLVFGSIDVNNKEVVCGRFNRDIAVKVTSMLLEQDNMKLLTMLDDEDYFNMEVNKALNILKTKP